MKAKLIKETLYAQPDGNIIGNPEVNMEDLIEIIDNTKERRLFPKDLDNIVDFLIELNDRNAADILLERLFNLHPYIIKDIQMGGPFKLSLVNYLKFYDQVRTKRNIFPPLSMN